LNNISLKNIKFDDLDLIFRWRNSHSAIKYSLSRKRIKLSDHTTWFKRRMMQKPLLFWKLKKNTSNIGFVRLDKNKNYLLGYFIDKKYRNKKYGSLIINKMLRKKNLKAILRKKNKIFAFTRKNNKKSINALISNNFYKIIEKKEYIKFRYENRK
tara:strand:- start:54 stop:518 length:465 start_codon:yes stop_codon:yes gene_type:complete